MKIAMFGGSFNPIHNAHIQMALTAVKELDLDKLLFVPAYISPFKQNVNADLTAQNDDRIEMVKKAISDSKCDKFECENCEIERGGISYTIDTIKYLNKKYDTKIKLLIGDDLAFDFKNWRSHEEIAQLSDIVIAQRGHEVKRDFLYPYTPLHNVIVDLSSTKVREALDNGMSFESLVSPSVCEYIKRKKLYGYSKGLVRRIDLFIRNNVSCRRYWHSVRVAETAEKLCAHYGLDTKKAYLAGIAHDMCKDFPEEKLLELAQKDAFPVSELEMQKPALLHGPAAARLLGTEYGIIDNDVLEAVRNHTFGNAGISDLAMLVFIADKIEPGRPQANKEYYDRLLALPLYQMVLSVVEENILYLKKRNIPVSPLSLEMREWLKEK